MSNKKVIAFDLDGTLAESKSIVSQEMYDLLLDLAIYYQVAIISGGAWSQFEKQLLRWQDPKSDYRQLEKLTCLPTSGTSMYKYIYAPVQERGHWNCKYQENLTPTETAEILKSLYTAISDEGGALFNEVYGNQIEHRGSQITFSALGQEAPTDKKKTWDPDYDKRKDLIFNLSLDLPEYHIRYGGSSSVDITRKGMDKSYGIKKLYELHNCSIEDILFIGDALEPPGNDYAVKKMGVDCIETSGPDQTKKIIKKLIKDFFNET